MSWQYIWQFIVNPPPWLQSLEILLAVLAIPASVYYGGRWLISYFWPLRIKVLGTAACKYEPELREYIVIVPEVEILVRRPITVKARCIQLEGDKNCYPNADDRYSNIERWEQSNIYEMRFAPEIYSEDDMPEGLRNKRIIKGTIILGKWKSNLFPIERVNVISEGDIVLSR